VPARTLVADHDAWERAAQYVVDRRTSLGLTASEVVRRARPGLSLAVLSQIENARKNRYAIRTLAALCRGLDWTPASIHHIVDGREPMLAGTPQRAPAGYDVDFDDEDERDLWALTRLPEELRWRLILEVRASRLGRRRAAPSG